jgi:maltose-binding protein MalE
MTDRELMQMALDALQKIYIAPEHDEYIRVWWPACEESIKALRDRLAQPEREWVGLTEDEKQFFKAMGFSGIDIVEAKLKEKNT